MVIAGLGAIAGGVRRHQPLRFIEVVSGVVDTIEQRPQAEAKQIHLVVTAQVAEVILELPWQRLVAPTMANRQAAAPSASA